MLIALLAGSIGQALKGDCRSGEREDYVWQKMKTGPILMTVLLAINVGCGDDEKASVSCEQTCVHIRDGQVPLIECSYSNRVFDPTNPDMINEQSIDPRAESADQPYFRTSNDYQIVQTGDCP